VVVFVTIVYSLPSLGWSGSFCDDKAGGVAVVGRGYLRVSIVFAVVMCLK